MGIDVLVYASHTEKLAHVLRRVQQEILAQIDALFQTLQNFPSYSKAKVFHFAVEGFHRVLFAVYPVDVLSTNEDAIVSIRREYHTSYGLPMDRPLIRMVKAILYTNNSTLLTIFNRKLLNVHASLGSPGIGTQYSVKGNYYYFHYNQDSFNDDGWGCAYRSLQTIQSWFILQNYTSKPVQTHREIQKTVYGMGGQWTKSFIGSREWIGSLEIQGVLEQYMGISSKIIHVSRGSDISDHIIPLINHFNSQGTPVMIGGGNLAYTLLGIETNPQKGKTMLLILDPHYTGKDEIGTIIKKGWCGWKDIPTIFLDTCFYNLCLPLVPGSSGLEKI